jgi:predicted NAD/FAD-dependent oxidoreductase
MLEQSRFRDWFYYRAREGTAPAFKSLAKATQKVIAIGDAVEAGKSKAAISSAFEAALLTH